MELIDIPQPKPELLASVVVPARDEEELIGACIRALGAQRGIAPSAWEILLVLDGCSDATCDRALAAATETPGLLLHTLQTDGLGAGGARAKGMDSACQRLDQVGRHGGLIATTDADSVVEPDWLFRQLEATAAGAEAVGGLITLEGNGAALEPGTLKRRRRDHEFRLDRLSADAPTEHPFFGGASIGITARAYREVGGMEALESLEDEALARRLRSFGVEIHRLDSVQVITSARTQGRASRGLALDLMVSEWRHRRSWSVSDFPLDQLLDDKRKSVSLILPAKEVASTITATVEELAPLRSAGLLDELIVVDADSVDGTAELAHAAGASVLRESELQAEFGPCRGKGDAMWRAASAASGQVIAFCDTDSSDFTADFALGLLGPILTEPGVRLVKGAFERPFRAGTEILAGEGGRVTELVARPLLNLHFPALAAIDQPLAGEIAIERGLFEQLHVPVGYGVEMAMLIDCLRLVGLDAIGQTHLGTRQNRHQPLRALGSMAYEVIVATHARLEGVKTPSPGPLVLPGTDGGRLEPRCEERPPLAELGAYGRARAGV